MSRIKFCRDCKHYIAESKQGKDRCGSRHDPNIVTGESHFYPCSTERQSGNKAYCGRRAIYFEPKEDSK